MHTDVEMNLRVGKTMHTYSIPPCCRQMQGAGWMFVILASPRARVHAAGCMHPILPNQTLLTMQRLQLPRCQTAPNSPSSCGADSQGFMCGPRVFVQVPLSLPSPVLWDREQTVLQDWNTVTKGRWGLVCCQGIPVGWCHLSLSCFV